MKIGKWQQASYFFLLALSTQFLVVLQTSPSFWGALPLLKHLPAPIAWLPVVVFFSLFRGIYSGLLSCFLLGLILAPTTASSVGHIVLTSLIILALCKAIKSRVFSPEIRYFFILTALSIFFANLNLWVIALLQDDHGGSFPPLHRWLGQALTTLPVALVIFHLHIVIDKITLRNLPSPLNSQSQA